MVEPGGKLKLVLTVDSDPDWHVYACEPRDPELVAKPTLIAVGEPADWQRSVPVASAEPVVKQPGAGEPAVRYHTGQVRWTMELRVPRDVVPGNLRLAGIVGYQTCTDGGCDAPRAARFAADFMVGSGVTDAQQPLAFTNARYSEAARLAAASRGGARKSRRRRLRPPPTRRPPGRALT